MSGEAFVVNWVDTPIIVRMTEAVVAGIRVSQTSFGQVNVMGGVAGPPGADGLDADDLMALHILDPTPHPAYDDMPSLTLLFENGLI